MPRSPDGAQPIHVIIVLGAKNDTEGVLTETAVERAKGALREHRKRPGTKLMLTGGCGHFNQAKMPHAHYMAQYLVRQGINPDSILPFVESTTTVEDAVFCKRALDGSTLGPVCIVTSAVHMPKARLIFEHFFDPAILTFVSTPNGLSKSLLSEYERKEAKALGVIQRQGGVIYDGKLFLRRQPSITVKAQPPAST